MYTGSIEWKSSNSSMGKKSEVSMEYKKNNVTGSTTCSAMVRTGMIYSYIVRFVRLNKVENFNLYFLRVHFPIKKGLINFLKPSTLTFVLIVIANVRIAIITLYMYIINQIISTVENLVNKSEWNY